jgi:hypothetical protein
MDIGTAMQAMRDPAGVPASPVLFQVLMVLTWVFHIAFVNLTLGSAGLAIFSFYRNPANEYWTRLSIALTKVAKVSVSLLIVLGVAPLLFTQVIYDPQWYTANVLSARWVIIFIGTLIVAYCLWFTFYWGNHEGARRHIGLYAIVALLLFLLDGLIMHVLSFQSIQPQHWMAWYAPNGVPDTTGSHLHGIEWPRYLFIISLSVPAVGLFLTAYADYFSVRADMPKAYLDFARGLGRRLAAWGGTIAIPLLVWWHFDLSAGTGLVTHPLAWIMVLALAAMVVWMRRETAYRVNGYYAVTSGVLFLLLLAVWREIIRATYLARFHYTISNYKMNIDWPSTILFFLTILGIGSIVGGFYVTLLYRSGQTVGQYNASRLVSRLGNGAVAILLLWIATFFLFGLWVFIKNNGS